MPNKQDKTGRSTYKKVSPIIGQFAARPIKMMESPAYRILSLSAHRALSRIEIEMAQHGGKDNGKLPVTYEHFEEYGMDRHAIGPAIRELTALGFIEVTEQGRSGVAYARSPNKFRLTFRHCEGRLGDGTHEWRRIDTIKRAREVAEAARTPPQKIKSPVGVLRRDQWGKPTLATDLPVGVSPTTAVGNTPTTSISCDVGPQLEREAKSDAATLPMAA
jgi:hypothetical protein